MLRMLPLASQFVSLGLHFCLLANRASDSNTITRVADLGNGKLCGFPFASDELRHILAYPLLQQNIHHTLVDA